MKLLSFCSAFLLCLNLAFAIHSAAKTDTTNKITIPAKDLVRIAFGSCSKTTLPQPMWPFIIQNNPDLWIWLGDNIYGDTRNMLAMKELYETQKNHPEYTKLRNLCPIIGTWDDHDYGENDAGKEFPLKKESKALLLDFLNEPTNSERRKREGIYTSYTLGEGARQIKIFILDSRTFRDAFNHGLPNYTGDILGKEQWQWLEEELKNSRAAINIIVNGTQVIPNLQKGEKWANFPEAREKLFKVIKSSQAKGVILLSGDRHFGEISKANPENMSYPIYEVTSSGLTHSMKELKGSLNPYRVQSFVKDLNFGIIEIDWSQNHPKLKLQLRGLNNQLYVEEIIEY